MLNQLSLKDYEDVFQSEESKSQIAVDDPTDRKKLPTITDQVRKEMEATVWDSEQDLILQDKMNQDMTPYDRDWMPQLREEVQDTMLENTLADDKKRRELMPQFKSQEKLVWVDTLKEKSDIEANRLAVKFNLPLDLAKDLMKEHIFEKKRQEEEKIKLDEHKKLKEHVKASKEQLKKIKKYDLGDFEDDNFLPNHPAQAGIDPNTKGKALEKKLKEKYFGLVQVRDAPRNEGMMDANYIPDKMESFNIYWKKMYKRFFDWTTGHFHDLSSNLLTQTCGKTVNIMSIMPSNSMTVLHCFWDFDHFTHGMYSHQKDKELIDEINRRLNIYGNKVLAWKMMQDCGTKKKMQFRFYFSTNLERTALNDRMSEAQKLDFFLGQVKSEYQLMGKKLEEDDQVDIVTALELRSDAYIESYSTGQAEYQALQTNKREKKVARKFDENGKRIRDNRTPDGKRKKTKKVDKRVEFWKSIGLDTKLIKEGFKNS